MTSSGRTDSSGEFEWSLDSDLEQHCLSVTVEMDSSQAGLSIGEERDKTAGQIDFDGSIFM